MTTETTSTVSEPQKTKVVYRSTSSDAVYGLGFIGALAYYLSHATSVWIGILGIMKAMVWPAMLVYEMLKYLRI